MGAEAGPRTFGIRERVREVVAREIRVYPCHVNRASELGHDCIRYLVYSRTDWDKKLLHDAGLELIFREGKLQEPAIMRTLEEAGYTVVEQQRAFSDDEGLQITGHIDGKLLEDGKTTPVEAKSSSPHVFARLTGFSDFLRDLLNAKEPWLRKYPAQITSYMALDTGPDGKPKSREAVFVFKNKSSGDLFDPVVELDGEYWESLKKRAEAVNFHVQSRTLPGRIKDATICEECAFRHVCMPDVDFGDEVEFVRELEPLLERRAELQSWKESEPRVVELEAVEARVRELVAGRNKIIAGRWRGRASRVDVKERVQKAYSYDRWSWRKAEGSPTGN